MDGGPWQATVHEVAKELDATEQLTLSLLSLRVLSLYHLFSLLLTDMTQNGRGLGFFLSRGLWSMFFIFKVSEWFDLIILLLVLYIRKVRRIK